MRNCLLRSLGGLIYCKSGHIQDSRDSLMCVDMIRFACIRIALRYRICWTFAWLYSFSYQLSTRKAVNKEWLITLRYDAMSSFTHFPSTTYGACLLAIHVYEQSQPYQRNHSLLYKVQSIFVLCGTLMIGGLLITKIHSIRVWYHFGINIKVMVDCIGRICLRGECHFMVIFKTLLLIEMANSWSKYHWDIQNPSYHTCRSV